MNFLWQDIRQIQTRLNYVRRGIKYKKLSGWNDSFLVFKKIITAQEAQSHAKRHDAL